MNREMEVALLGIIYHEALDSATFHKLKDGRKGGRPKTARKF